MTISIRMVLAVVGVASALCACSAADDLSHTSQGATAGAAFTTFDRELDGCAPGSQNGINCNHYVCEDRVYINGGPNRPRGGNVLADGTYYFAVLAPGHQNGGAADGAEGNLSDNVAHGGTDLGSGDTIADRTFTVTGGVLSYTGPHPIGTSPNGQPIVRVAPFDETPNRGGVYILAICPVGSSSPADCKFDAFKTARCDTPPPPPPCSDKCHGEPGCVECPPPPPPPCSDKCHGEVGCVECPPVCDPTCDPHACADCTPCIE